MSKEQRFVCHSCESNPHVDGCPYVEYLVEVVDDTKPEPGSWADVARMMAAISSDDDTDWDAWKDEMKERDLG